MRKRVTRRGFLGGSTAFGMAAASLSTENVEAANVDSLRKPFMDQYYKGALHIVEGIRDTQVGNIAKAMEKAYEIQSKGGKIHSQVVFGHYSGYAGAKDIPGQPWVLPQSSLQPKKEVLDAIQKGDFLLSNRFFADAKPIHDRGVFVAGITTNYFKHYKTPPNGLLPERMALPSIEECSDLVIDSQMPWDNGLVTDPHNPRFKLCPSTGIAQFAVYWACTASLANLIGTKGKGSSSEPAQKYLDILCDRFLQVATDRPKIDRIARELADLTYGKGSKFMVYGHPYAIEGYGSGNMFVSDAVGAASGSKIGAGYNASRLQEKDIVLICGVASNYPDEIKVAREARGKKAHTVAICPFSSDGDASGDRLFREVDDALYAYADESAGVIAAPGFNSKVSPIAGLTGLLIHWMLMAQWTDHLDRRGAMPYYWQGMHETGGNDYNALIKAYFDQRGY
ncbi:MAG: phosphoheptose isomerase family protein [Candidatus Latescibacterota bacterium]